jgi:hypothetical protein
VTRETNAQSTVAASVVALVVAAALFQSRPPAIPAFHTLPDGQAHALYTAAAEAEVTARGQASGRFRGSPWSQDDDFHNKEGKFIRNYAKAHGVAMASAIDALDRGMRAHWPTPNGTPLDQKVIPCRPRLSY